MERRVAIAQGHARPTLLAAAAFAVAAPLAALVPHDTGTWLPLHLLLVGALLTAVSGATQLLAVTWSAAPAPADRLVRAQRVSVVLGAAAVAAGREAGSDAVTGAGAVLVATGLCLLGVILLGVRRHGRLERFHPATEAYLIAVGFGLVGVAMGGALAVASTGEWWPRLRGAHLAVNVLGLVGIVVAATLPHFVATQARMKTSGRAEPRRLRRHTAALAGATVLAAGGQLVGRPGAAAVGVLAYAAALAAVVTTLPRPGRRQLAWAGPRLVQLAAGGAWWMAMVLAVAVVWLTGGGGEGRVLAALAVGGFAQILAASLAYLGPVVRGGGHERLTAGFATTASWAGLALANVAAVALLVGAGSAAAVAVAGWAMDTGWRAMRLLTDHGPVEQPG